MFNKNDRAKKSLFDLALADVMQRGGQGAGGRVHGNNAGDEEEDDYMSEKFLVVEPEKKSTIGKKRAAPPPPPRQLPKKEAVFDCVYIDIGGGIERVINDFLFFHKEKKALEDGLAKKIDESNKGFQLLSKLGYKCVSY